MLSPSENALSEFAVYEDSMYLYYITMMLMCFFRRISWQTVGKPVCYCAYINHKRIYRIHTLYAYSVYGIQLYTHIQTHMRTHRGVRANGCVIALMYEPSCYVLRDIVKKKIIIIRTQQIQWNWVRNFDYVRMTCVLSGWSDD